MQPKPVFAAMRTRHDVFKDVIGFAPLSFDRVAVRVGAEPSPSDPLTLLLALTGIAAITLAAAIIPARRAASVDPMCALRME